MLALDDPRWSTMLGGYREPYDPRPALAALEQGGDIGAALDQLWNGLHHQGDVDEASYAALPHIVRIHKLRPLPEWHVYAMAAVIEECRLTRANPEISADLRGAYDAALPDLSEIGLAELSSATDRDIVLSIIAVIAFVKGCTQLGSFALLAADEQEELLAY